VVKSQVRRKMQEIKGKVKIRRLKTRKVNKDSW
jgi:hypothetical protein